MNSMIAVHDLHNSFRSPLPALEGPLRGLRTILSRHGMDNGRRDARVSELAELLQLGEFMVLQTTHDMDDIEQLCSRVIVINCGALGFDGSTSELRQRIGLPTMIRVT